MPEIKDRVMYLPHSCHAKEKDTYGGYPWAIGRKRQKVVAGKLQHIVEELEGRDLDEFLKSVRSGPNPAEAAKNVVYLRPKSVWPALVRSVNEDGTVNLDIVGGNPGVTLHYDNVPVKALYDLKDEDSHVCYPLTASQDIPPQMELAFLTLERR